MKLTIEQKKLGRKYNILRLLCTDLQNGRTSELQKLYETAGLSNNRKLQQRLYKRRTVGEPFLNMVYSDMIYIVVDEIMANPDLEDYFEDLYTIRFPHIKDSFLKLEELYKQNKKNSKPIMLRGMDFFYFSYLIYASDIFNDPKDLNLPSFEEDMQTLQFAYYTIDKDFVNGNFMFSGEENEVFKSPLFTKYVNKKKNRLAEHLGVPVTELCSYIHNEMKSHRTEDGTPIRPGFVGTIELMTKSIINNKYGGTIWYEVVTSDDKDTQGKLNYVPDVETIIHDYYQSFVLTRYAEKLYNKEPFNKITLSRECETPGVEYDYSMILCMYEMDVLYKMFSSMMEKYYADFSWEKSVKQRMEERYEKIIDDLQGIIRQKVAQIEKLSTDNSNLSLQITDDISKATAPLMADSNKLYQKLEKQNEEIEKLKKQLKYQDEFIAELNKDDKVAATDTSYDLESLQGKRYLFVGRCGDALPELRHQFPNSIFMESENANISGIKVDAVVMLVKWMSHSMYYKVKSSNNFLDIPCVMCNGKNKDGILQKVYDQMF